MAEEFAFEQRFGQGGTIQRDKGTQFARAVEVNRARSEFLCPCRFRPESKRWNRTARPASMN